jgi:hypothetical protein
LVEDSYEVDDRFSVEECLGDMFPVTVTATKGALSSHHKQDGNK